MDNSHYTYYNFISNELLKYSPFYIDGDDFYNLYKKFDELSNTYIEYNQLSNDLELITNIMFCEFGIDYGSKQDVDILYSSILDKFSNGYLSNEENVSNLLEIIDKNIIK